MVEECVQQSQLHCNHSFGRQTIKLFSEYPFRAKSTAEIDFSCQHQFVCVLNFSNSELSELASSSASVICYILRTYKRMLQVELSAMHESLSCCRQKGDREADEDILCSMKDGGSRSPRPWRWHNIDPPTPEPEVQGLLALSAMLSSALLPPGSLSETQG